MVRFCLANHTGTKDLCVNPIAPLFAWTAQVGDHISVLCADDGMVLTKLLHFDGHEEKGKDVCPAHLKLTLSP